MKEERKQQMKDILKGLNDKQYEAVINTEGPCLVIAGAGSGKTKVLTHKIAYIMGEQKALPWNILAITFTNKAANEMKERIEGLVGDAGKDMWIGTFHSICVRILRKFIDRIGYDSSFIIFDTSDQKTLVKQCMKELQIDDKTFNERGVLSEISNAKNEMLEPDQYSIRVGNDFRKSKIAKIYELYQKRLKDNNAIDFDDIINFTVKILMENPDVLEYYANKFKYVLVDEYQDTNYSQYLLVKQLAAPQDKVCVVGDDAQSIYSFRGADISNILNFQKGYANAKLFKLERNYRSTQTIVNAANSLIRHNKGQIPKTVYSELRIGERICLATHMSDRDEAKAVAQQIHLLKRLNADYLSYDDIAVMYRTNAQSRVIEDELRQLSIPYRIYGGTSFYQRKEIKDALGYLRLATNLSDDEAFLRIVNYPTRGIGDTTVNKLYEAARNNKSSLMEVASSPENIGKELSVAAQKKVLEFAQMIHRFVTQATEKDAYTFAKDVLTESGIMREAKADTTQEGIARWENLEEMLSSIHEFCERRKKEGEEFTYITDFLSEVSLLTDQDEHIDDTQARVTLLTIHAAKGLEFNTTFIVGMEENLFPSAFCQTVREMEEERRLLYVAITRSMERCYLMYARQRFRNGQVNFTTPSRFLKDIDSQFIIQTDGSQPMLKNVRTERKASATSKRNTSPSFHLISTTGPQEKGKRKLFVQNGNKMTA